LPDNLLIIATGASTNDKDNLKNENSASNEESNADSRNNRSSSKTVFRKLFILHNLLIYFRSVNLLFLTNRLTEIHRLLDGHFLRLIELVYLQILLPNFGFIQN